MNTSIKDLPMVSVIIPVFNRPDDIERLLCSFETLRYPGKIQIYIVDDAGTTDYTPIFDNFRKRCPQIALTVIKLPENVGPAISRNKALERVQKGLVWFLDSDTEIFQEGMLAKTVEIFRRYPEVKAVGEEVFFFGEEPVTFSANWHDNFFFDSTFRKFEDSTAGYRSCIATANLIVKREMFDVVGSFNPKLNMFEDVDFCFRMRGKGYKLYGCKEIAVYHYASSKGRGGEYNFYKNLKNYTRIFHHSRINLVALNKPEILPWLPIMDFILGAKIFLRQYSSDYNTSSVISNKTGKNLGFLSYALYHLSAMVKSYGYGYKVFFTKKIKRC